MSTLKADAVTSAQDNTALTLSGTGTGGVKVNDFFVQTKGADIASDTALTLGKDGNQFDVTGTTTITSIATQGIGSYVTLHFDGALTFTHHSTNLILPGAANITTAAGDIAVMYEYASADWRCVSYSKASGAAVAGGLVPLAQIDSSSQASADFDDIFTTTYDQYKFIGYNIGPETDDTDLYIRVSSDSGSTWQASTTYSNACHGMTGNGTRIKYTSGDSAFIMSWLTIGAGNGVYSNAKAGVGFDLTVYDPLNTTYSFQLTWLSTYMIASTTHGIMAGSGRYDSPSNAWDSIQFIMSAGDADFIIKAYGVANS